MSQVDSQHFDGCSANRSSSDQDWTIPAEMALPSLVPGVEEPCPSARVWINPRKVWSFVMIASKACQGQVIELGFAAVLFGNYVIKLMKSGGKGLWKQAIFAAVGRAAPDRSVKGFVHGDQPRCGVS
jgi:hypothetical protein